MLYEVITPNALFSVNVVARKPEKNTPETNPPFMSGVPELLVSYNFV